MSASLFVTLALAWVLLPVVLVFLPLLRVRAQRFARQPAGFESVPGYLVELLLPEGTELVQRGFELVGALRMRDNDVSPPDERWGYHLVHRGLDVHAYLRASSTPNRARPVMLIFESYVGDASAPRLVATLHERFTDRFVASARCVPHYVALADLGALLEAHLTRRDVLGQPVLAVEGDEALAVSSACWSAWLDEALAAGRWVPAPEAGAFRMTTWSALRYAVRYRLDRDGRRILAESQRVSASEDPAPVEEEVAALLRLDALLSRPIARVQSLGLFTLGTVLFVAWFGLDGWELALAISGTVLFHELGHGAAMRLAGYRDVRVYFVPFMGGATSGQKRDASIHQECFVLLAGPVPGLLVGGALGVAIGLGALPSVPWLVTVVASLLAVNYLNLLPVFPLDGGRLTHRLVAGRVPVLEIAVRLVAIVVLGLGALAGGGALLGVLAAILVVGTRAAWRVAVRERALRREGADRLPAEARLIAILRSLDGVRGWTPRLVAARQLQLRLDAPDASWPARLAWGVLYVVIVVVPVGVGAAVWLAGAAANGLERSAALFDTEARFACGELGAIDPTATTLVCEGDAPAARDALLAYQDLAPRCVAPPWRDQPTDEALRARATLRELREAQMEVFRQRASEGLGAVAWSSGSGALAEQAQAAVTARIAARRADPDFDAVVADLFVGVAQLPENEAAIEARVGADPACEVVWVAGIDEGRFAVSVYPGPREAGFPDPECGALWLCEHGCTAVGTSHWADR